MKLSIIRKFKGKTAHSFVIQSRMQFGLFPKIVPTPLDGCRANAMKRSMPAPPFLQVHIKLHWNIARNSIAKCRICMMFHIFLEY